MKKHQGIVRALLACGVLSAIVYISTDVLAAMQWDGYRIADRALSELMAVGSPTRSFILPGMTLYNLLILAFGTGVLLSAGSKRSLKVTGILLQIYGVVSWLGLVVFPLRPDSGIVGSTMPLSGVLHSVATAALVLLMFGFIGFGSGARGRGFRIYSLLTFALVLAGGLWAGSMVTRVASGIPTPGFGLIERMNIYSSVIWVAMLGVALLGRDRQDAPEEAGGEGRKHVAILVGSPQKHGATFRAASIFASHLERLGDVQTEIIQLSDYDIGTCRGCKVCVTRGEERCPLKDDRDLVINRMLEADALVIASPNYSWQVPGVLKVFLDRLAFAMHRPRFHGKTASAIVVEGIGFGGRVRKYLQFTAGSLGFDVVKGSVSKTLEPMTADATAKMDERLAKHAARFHDRLMQPAFRSPSLFKLAMFRMGRTGIRLHAQGLLDWDYYRDQGWFESDYYYPVSLGWPKRAFGRFLDWFTERAGLFSVAEE